MSIKVGIIVPVLYNMPGFLDLVKSVDRPILPIVIDNSSDNKGVSASWNIGLDRAVEAGCEVAVVCNDDIVLAPATLNKIVFSVLAGGADLVTPFNTRDEDYSHISGYQIIDSPDYSCFAVMPEQFLRRFGYFDENFTPAYFEDNDMHYRISLVGGSDKKRTDAPFYHKGSVTQNWGGAQVVSSPMFEKNREYYAKKWGGWPGKEVYTHPFNNPDNDWRHW